MALSAQYLQCCFHICGQRGVWGSQSQSLHRHQKTPKNYALNSVANLATLSLDLATFQTPLATFFYKKKRLATNLATFGKTLATFQMLPVLSREREILSYTSPCVCSDQ